MANVDSNKKFLSLFNARKSAALDINIKTGELVVICTKSKNGIEGNGTPSQPYNDEWLRVALCIKGEYKEA